jgi:hypothetical protein
MTMKATYEDKTVVVRTVTLTLSGKEADELFTELHRAWKNSKYNGRTDPRINQLYGELYGAGARSSE